MLKRVSVDFFFHRLHSMASAGFKTRCSQALLKMMFVMAAGCIRQALFLSVDYLVVRTFFFSSKESCQARHPGRQAASLWSRSGLDISQKPASRQHPPYVHPVHSVKFRCGFFFCSFFGNCNLCAKNEREAKQRYFWPELSLILFRLSPNF